MVLFKGTFDGRSALVTGGGSGIGAELVGALVAAGADVVCTDVDEAAAARVAASVVGPGSARSEALDVTDPIAFQAVVDGMVAGFGRIDYLFNNAGILFGGPIEALSLDQWNQIIDVNLRGVVHGVSAAYPQMIKAQSGHIVNIGSVAGLVAAGLITSYVATKHAVVGLSLALRTEAAGHGVKVTVVCPSVIETPILDKGAVGGFEGRDFFLTGRIKRGYDAQSLVQDALAGVAANRAMVLAPRNARVAFLVNRLSPGLIQRVGTKRIAEQQAAIAARTPPPVS